MRETMTAPNQVLSEDIEREEGRGAVNQATQPHDRAPPGWVCCPSIHSVALFCFVALCPFTPPSFFSEAFESTQLCRMSTCLQVLQNAVAGQTDPPDHRKPSKAGTKPSGMVTKSSSKDSKPTTKTQQKHQQNCFRCIPVGIDMLEVIALPSSTPTAFLEGIKGLLVWL